MKLPVKNLQNEVVREIEISDEIFTYPYREHLIHAAVVAHLAAQRRGTHKTKVRSEVSGSGKKPWRQKGTGRARVGSLRSPLWRKGGVVHGPQPRNYEQGLSAREKRNALRSALSRKLLEQEVMVVDSFELVTHRTADLSGTMSILGVSGKALLVDRFDNENLHLASRNNPRLKAVDALAVSVYDVVDRAQVVVSAAALERLSEVLGK